MLTKQTDVVGQISIWAVPKSNPEPGEEPFEYELYSEYASPWKQGAVKVNTLAVTLTVPAGLNLIQKAVETLKEAQDELRKECVEKVEKLEDRIKELALLTHQPSPNGNGGDTDGVTILHPE